MGGPTETDHDNSAAASGQGAAPETVPLLPDAGYRELINASNDIRWIVDDRLRIRWTSPALTELLGWSTELLSGQLVSLLVPPEELNLYTAVLNNAADKPGKRVGFELALLRADGSRAVCAGTATDLRLNPAVGGFATNVHDISEQRSLVEQLARRSLFDDITGLPNRALLKDRLDQILDVSRKDAELNTSVVVADIDHFSAINSTLGWSLADDLLHQIAQRLRGGLADDVLVGRQSGDVFVVARVDSAANPGELVAAVNRCFHEPYLLGTTKSLVSVGMGVVTAQDADSADEVIRQARVASREAKRHGTGQASTYSAPLDIRSSVRRDTENQLRVGFENGELRVHYQPIVDMASLRPVGIEALVRWEHPERGLIPPSEFITTAEETGLMIPIGAWVFDTTMSAATALSASSGFRLFAAVNFSMSQIHDPDMVNTVQTSISRHNVDPSMVHVEITEATLQSHHGQVTGPLSRLDQLGVVVSLDDFGTGDSSLDRLRNSPVTTVKIDPVFTRGAIDDPKIVAGLLTLAHSFELSPIAEGVETAAELEALRTLGCRLSQGYLHSRPLPFDELAKWLKTSAMAP